MNPPKNIQKMMILMIILKSSVMQTYHNEPAMTTEEPKHTKQNQKNTKIEFARKIIKGYSNQDEERLFGKNYQRKHSINLIEDKNTEEGSTPTTDKKGQEKK